MPDRELTWRQAVERVMAEVGEPLHYAEISQRIVDGQLRTNPGATPAQTVATVFSNSLRDDGEKSPFRRVGRGVYVLKDGSRSTADTPRTVPDLPGPGAAAGSAQAADEVVVVDSAGDAAEEMGLINAFGMFWRRDLVDWSRLGDERLLGQQQHGSRVVNFAEQSGVYLLYDSSRVIYVGQVTKERMWRRLWDHTRDRLEGRWDRFSWFGVQRVGEDGILLEAPREFGLGMLITTMEALLIEGLEPPQNRRQGDGFKPVEFLQARDEVLEQKRQKEVLAAALRDAGLTSVLRGAHNVEPRTSARVMKVSLAWGCTSKTGGFGQPIRAGPTAAAPCPGLLV